ncbi:MAG TPA: ABC transporter ATP-binding protein [Solirubrobacteraceae bacterium]|nr:ABC transporter ATP-binding protein [Solirubrobacteraceae bacterium]
MPVLAAEGIVKRYGDREALGGVSLAVDAGERIALIGANGAGKTTLLSILAGVQQATAGEIGLSPREVGWVPQQPAVYSRLTVRENLSLFARLERVGDPDGAVERMLEQTGLRDREDEELGRLSGGNRQRVNIAVGLLAEPAVVLLDEPSSSLDPGQRERLWAFVDALAAEGTAVIFSTHNVVEVERHSDRVLLLEQGRLIFEGLPAELRAAAGSAPRDFEEAVVAFLRARA